MCVSVALLTCMLPQAQVLVVAAFQALPLHRSSLIEEVMSAVLNNLGSKITCRQFLACDQGPVYIQLPVALMMQLVQVSGGLE